MLKNYKKILMFFNYLLTAFILFFNRAFIGIGVFGYRIGEILVGICLFLSILYLVSNQKFLNEFLKIPKILHLFIKAVFLLTILRITTEIMISQSFQIEFIRYSSYVWTLIFLFNFKNFQKITKISPKIFVVILFLLYFLQLSGYPEIILNLFQTYSDKIIFFKPADLFIGVVFLYTFLSLNSKNKYNILILVFYLPMFLFLSRGSFLGITVFTIFIFYETYKKQDLSVFFKIISLSIVVFYISSTLITYDVKNNENSNLNIIYTNTQQSVINTIVENKNFDNTAKISIQNKRLYSSDNNINWRLQIWQDEIIYTIDNNIFFGNGFFDIMESMKLDFRKGFDKQNIYPHNFFITIFSTGGIIYLILFCFIYFYIFLSTKNLQIKAVLLSGLIVACFDVAMEGVQYPFMFYLTLGILLEKSNK